jgi:hypothetical protein
VFVISLLFHHSHLLLHLNIAGRKKLQDFGWLISTILLVFNHFEQFRRELLEGTAKRSWARVGWVETYREPASPVVILSEALSAREREPKNPCPA